MELTTVWFSPIAFLLIGYFILEGFDFGVGMLCRCSAQRRHGAARDDQHHRPGLGRQRGLVLIAGGAMFAAFPEWYATCSPASTCRCC